MSLADSKLLLLAIDAHVTIDGPDIPWQRLISVDDKRVWFYSFSLSSRLIFLRHSLEYLNILSDNAQLVKNDAAYLKPDVVYTTVASEGHGTSLSVFP